jgi:UDP-N-acetylbacillosamine N-acetyltransferase
MKSLYIYGGCGHGLVLADIAKTCGYKKIIYIDDGNNKYPSFKDIQHIRNIPFALGIGNNYIRKKLFKKLQNHNCEIITLIHPSAIISSDVKIGKGTVIMPNVLINAGSTIGKGVILNTSCVIEHENKIHNFVHISPNATLAGSVIVKKNSHIGLGSIILQGVHIGKNCIIGAGSVVLKNIRNRTLCFGNPCKIIKEID